MDQVFQSLAAAGPVALVLGIAVYTLWNANKEERLRHATEEERLRGEYVALLKQLVGAVNKSGSQESHGGS